MAPRRQHRFELRLTGRENKKLKELAAAGKVTSSTVLRRLIMLEPLPGPLPEGLDLVDAFETTREAHEAAARAIEKHFLPLLHAAIARRDEAAAREIVRRIPSNSVANAFALDAMRQAKFTLNEIAAVPRRA